MGNTKGVDEVLEVVAQVLIRCTVMGIIVLLIWWGVLAFAGDLAYAAHATYGYSLVFRQRCTALIDDVPSANK